MTHRTHYLINGVARCGQPHRRSWTTDPKKVTCKTCKRLMSGEVE